MMKSSLKRYEDTIQYIGSLGVGGLLLVNQLNKLILTDNLKEEVSKQIELGFTFGPKNTDQRHALRALLLCQYVFIGKIWKKYFTYDLTLCSYLPTDWKSQSVAHWKFRTQAEVNQAIAIYMRTNPVPFYLADVAEDTPDFIEPDILKITRENFTVKNKPSCYGAVMIWLFMSGFTSYQWLLRYSGASGEAPLTEAFGPPTQTLYKADDVKPLEEIRADLIHRGNFIHLYCKEGGRWNGHWMVSRGHGKACGCNNDTSEIGVLNTYSKDATIIGQFQSYKSIIGSVNNGQEKRWRGIIDYYNPKQNNNFF